MEENCRSNVIDYRELMQITNYKKHLLVTAAALGLLAISFVLARFELTLLAAVVGLIVAAVVGTFILKKPIFGVLIVAFLLPFERIGSIEVGALTLRMSQVVAAVVILAYVWDALLSKKFSFQKNPIALLLMGFLVANLVSLFSALNVSRGLQVWIFTAFVMLFSLAVTQLIRKKAHVKKVVWILLFSATIVSLFGLFQFVGDLIGLPPSLTGLSELYTKDVFGFPRIQSTALEPLYFANYLLIPIGIVLALLLSPLRTHRAWLWVALLMLFSVNFVLTLSRGGYFGLAVLVLFVAFINFRRVFSKRNLILYSALILVALVSVTALLGLSHNARQSAEAFQRQALEITSGASYTERAGTITDAIEIWKAHPIFGVGPGNFGPHVARNPLVTPEKGWLIVNNETIELLAETGIVGLGIFILILIVLAIRSMHALRAACIDPSLKAILTGVYAAFLATIVQYQTFSTLFILHIWFLIGFLVALQNIALKQNKNLKNPNECTPTREWF